MIFAQQTTAFYIPTITYIYNDEELMNQKEFPTLISLIFTKKDEGRMLSKFLEEMDYRFMDIWYHELSQKVAEYISEEYLTKSNGCGRVQEMTKSDEKNNELVEEAYNTTKKSSAVQLIVQNSRARSLSWLKYVTDDMKFRNKIYVMGTSNGREVYHNDYEKILRNPNGSDDSVIFPLLALSNIQLKSLNKDLADPWVEERGNRTLDNLYRQGQAMRKIECTGGCRTSSWTPHVVAGTKMIGLALQEVLEQVGRTVSVTNLRRRIFRVIVNETREIDLDLDEDISLKARFVSREGL